MTVFDASVVVDALVSASAAGDNARDAIRGHRVLEVPAIFVAEAVSALRSLAGRGQLADGRAKAALVQLRATRTVQYPFEPFVERVWELRNNVTVYDGWYVALAEWLGTTLVTADDRLASATGPRCDVVHVRDHVG